MVEQHQPTLGEQLGLGRNWRPAQPFGWVWGRLDSSNGPLHLLVLHTTTGLTAFTFSPEDLRVFVGQAMEQSTGLVLP
jgi:hypothetical protein